MGRRMRVTPAPLYILLLICAPIYTFIAGIDGPLSRQEALEGGNTTLLCDTTPDSTDDEFMILVWYKNNVPIYSFEFPDKEWSDPVFNTSGRLKADLYRQPTALTITALTDDDQALYHCRVDFRLSPTRNIGVNLTVVVLPNPPFFMNEANYKVADKVGPYHDGDTLVLRCLVIGGRPPPRISWYSGNTLVDASDSNSDIPKVRENELYLPLTRDNAAALSCRASNTKLAPPQVATLDIELYLPAYNVSIHWVSGTADGVLQAGKPAVVKCTARGSYPQPDVSWWLDHRHLTHHSNQSWSNVSRTAESYLELNPTVGDNGATLACVATNSIMAPSRGSKADVLTLNVTYSPILEVNKIGFGNQNEVVELDSLHLECEVKANPPVLHFFWYFNDSLIRPGDIWGRNVSSQVLFVLESSREHTGRYSCAAANSIGETRAETIPITVFYPPECSNRGIRLIKETLSCNVKALPVPDTYFWHVQPAGFEAQHLTTGSHLLPLDQITGPLSDTLKATCSASNGIASQEVQCERTFSFEQLRPQQPQQCDLAYEYGEFHIRCLPVENATYYEVSVWRLSTSNSSLLLEKRASMGFGTSQALSQSGVGGVGGVSSAGGAWVVRAALGDMGAGDEAGALACNRYGCSRALLLRPTENLLQAAAPPWWQLPKDVGIAIGAVVAVILFVITTVLVIRLARRPRNKPTVPVIQVLQLDDVARNYLDNIADHKIRVSSSMRSCSSAYSEGSSESLPALPSYPAHPVITTSLDRRRNKFWDRWEPPPPDVTLTLHRESAV